MLMYLIEKLNPLGFLPPSSFSLKNSRVLCRLVLLHRFAVFYKYLPSCPRVHSSVRSSTPAPNVFTQSCLLSPLGPSNLMLHTADIDLDPFSTLLINSTKSPTLGRQYAPPFSWSPIQPYTVFTFYLLSIFPIWMHFLTHGFEVILFSALPSPWYSSVSQVCQGGLHSEEYLGSHYRKGEVHIVTFDKCGVVAPWCLLFYLSLPFREVDSDCMASPGHPSFAVFASCLVLSFILPCLGSTSHPSCVLFVPFPIRAPVWGFSWASRENRLFPALDSRLRSPGVKPVRCTVLSCLHVSLRLLAFVESRMCFLFSASPRVIPVMP